MKTDNVIKKFLGVWFALNPWGNCFSPAVCVYTAKKAKNNPRLARIILKFRTRSTLETTFYWRGGFNVNWNSAHLARRFGKFQDTDFGGVTVLSSRIFGQHVDL